jgi:hypothetical protein
MSRQKGSKASQLVACGGGGSQTSRFANTEDVIRGSGGGAGDFLDTSGLGGPRENEDTPDQGQERELLEESRWGHRGLARTSSTQT